MADREQGGCVICGAVEPYMFLDERTGQLYCQRHIGPTSDKIDKMLVWLLVKAAGGRISIPKGVIDAFNPYRATITEFTDPTTGDKVFECGENVSDLPPSNGR